MVLQPPTPTNNGGTTTSSSRYVSTATIITSNIPFVTCAILASLSTGGPTYAFGLYGASLKESLQLTQSQLATLSSANFCAGFFTWIPGLLVDRYGVRRAMAVGGLAGATFMTLYWAVATQVFLVKTQLLVATLCACGICVSLSNGLVIGAIYKILVCSCASTTKGSAVGIAKGYVGLGSGVYACIFQAVKAGWTTTTVKPSDLDFLLLAAVFAVVSCTLPACLLLPNQQQTMALWNNNHQKNNNSNNIIAKPQKQDQQFDKLTNRHLGILYIGLLALAIMVVGTSLQELLSSSSGTGLRHTARSHVSNGCWLVVLWIGPILSLLMMPTATNEKNDDTFKSLNEDSSSSTALSSRMMILRKEKYLVAGERSTLLPRYGQPESFYSQRTDPTCASSFYNDEEEPFLQDDYISDSEEECNDSNDNNHSNDNNSTNLALMELLQTSRAWLLLWIGIVLVGSGTMMTNNMGQMVESLSLVPLETVTPASMAIFSVAQAMSRIATGAMSDYALMQWRIPRPVFLIVASLLGVVSHALLAMTQDHDPSLFLAGVALSGAAFGMIWPLMVLLVGEIFGTAHMATNYLFYDGVASGMGTLLLSKFVSQQVYEAHITSSLTSSTTTCIGTDCFELSHWVAVLLCLSCVVAGSQVVRQTRQIYRKEQ